MRSQSLSAGQLARLTGVSTDALRHYERKGLLSPPPRTDGGYRKYPPDAVARVRVVQRALVVGFSLDELGRILKERAAGGAPCRKVRDIVQERLAALDRQLEDLRLLKLDMEALLNDWNAQLDRTPAGDRAHLLDGLGMTSSPRNPAAGRRRSSLSRASARP